MIIENNVLGDNEHNTPLALYMPIHPSNFSIKVHSAGGVENNFEIEYQNDEKKFAIPAEIDIKSAQVPAMPFDAEVPTKMKRK